jgi:phosphoglycolate phosphatase
MTIKALIFDFDNTIVHSNIDFWSMKISMAREAKAKGLDFGISEEEIPLTYTAGDMLEQAEKFVQFHPESQLVDKLWKIVEDFEYEGMKNLRLENGIHQTLEKLSKKGLILTLLTNNSRQPTLTALDHFKLKDFFSIIIAREDMQKMKPDKEGLVKTLQQLSLHPHQTVFIGDSWVDGLASNKAGIKFIHLKTREIKQEKHQIEIWKQMESLNELLTLFD